MSQESETEIKVFPTPPQIKIQLKAQAAGILSEGLVLTSFPHRGIRGIEREEPVRRFLRSHLPGRFHVGQGSIASSEKILDRQNDIIIADRDLCFMLLNTISSQLMVVESVHLIVEVRSRASELADVATSLRRVRGLKALPGLLQLSKRGSEEGCTKPPVHTVIIYQGPKNPQTLIGNIKAANEPDNQDGARLAIDFVLVLAKEESQNPDTGYLVGYGRTKFHHHYSPISGEQGLNGPKIIREGGDSFAYWYAAILQHLSGVSAYPPFLHSYLGEQMVFGRWEDQ